jgi:hypothetical protein
MFTIQYVIEAEGKTPDVIERMVLKHSRLADAAAAARSLLSGLSHLPMKLFRAAPASFLSAAWSEHVAADALPAARTSNIDRTNLFITPSVV